MIQVGFYLYLLSFLLSLLSVRYSLASAPTAKNKDYVDLVLSIVQYEKPTGVIRKGLCSNYLKEAKIGSTVACIHRPIHTLVKPLASGKPIVMIAAGSGIAPFRAVWQHLKTKEINKANNVLFFGCRDKSENLFEFESESAVRRITAFSREENSRKKYVQDVVEENGDLINDLIWEQEGAILVCGSVS